MTFNLKDAQLQTTDALPNGAATAYSTVQDLQNGGHGDFVAPCEILLTAPALNVTQQPDNKTLKYTIQSSVDSAFTSPIDEYTDVITQTGAGGAGAAAATFRCRLKTSVKRYLRVKMVGSASGNSSTASLIVNLLF